MSEINKVKACRLCLETNCRLFDIYKNNLVHVLNEFTSSSTSEMIGIPPYVCSFCCTLLKKATTFRKQCMETQNYLHEYSLIEPLTIDIIQKTDTTKIQNVLTTSKVTITSCVETELVEVPIIKQEDIELKSERNSDTNLDSELSDTIDEFSDSYNGNNTLEINVEDDLKRELPKDVIPVPIKKKKMTQKERDCQAQRERDRKNKEILINAVQKKISDSKIHSKLFYTYILDKYVQRTKPIVEKELLNLFDSDEELPERSVEDVTKLDIDKKVFYEFVNKKYT